MARGLAAVYTLYAQTAGVPGDGFKKDLVRDIAMPLVLSMLLASLKVHVCPAIKPQPPHGASNIRSHISQHLMTCALEGSIDLEGGVRR